MSIKQKRKPLSTYNPITKIDKGFLDDPSSPQKPTPIPKLHHTKPIKHPDPRNPPIPK